MRPRPGSGVYLHFRIGHLDLIHNCAQTCGFPNIHPRTSLTVAQRAPALVIPIERATRRQQGGSEFPSEVAVQLLEQLRLAFGAHQPQLRLSVLEEDQRRDAHDIETPHGFEVVVSINLADP